MNDKIEESYRRMLTEHGSIYLFEGTAIPTHYNRLGLSKSIDWETGVILKNFVEFYKPETICELGTFRGYSTSWLILGTLLNARGHVHAFEVFNEGEYGKMWYDEFGLPRIGFTYHTIPGGIWNYPDQVPDRIDMVYHDTQHLLKPTQLEMELLLPRMSDGGIILVDDMLHPDYKPMQAYFHGIFMNQPSWDWQVLQLGHGLGIARKK